MWSLWGGDSTGRKDNLLPNLFIFQKLCLLGGNATQTNNSFNKYLRRCCVFILIFNLYFSFLPINFPFLNVSTELHSSFSGSSNQKNIKNYKSHQIIFNE